MEPGDLPRVAEIDRGGLGDGAPLGDRLGELWRTVPIALVAEAPAAGIGGFAIVAEPAGGAAGHEWPATDIQGGRRLHLERVAFDPEFSGHGLGPMLFDEIDARIEALAAPGDPVTLTSIVQVDPPNRHAIEFHERRGFAEVARRPSDGATLALVARRYDVRS